MSVVHEYGLLLHRLLALEGTLAPRASFDVEDRNQNGVVRFDNTSVPFNEGTSTYEWDFGDGATSAEFEPAHRYEALGTYSVRLTMRGSDGSELSATRDVDIEAPDLSVLVHNPEAEFGPGESGNRLDIGDEFTVEVKVRATDGFGPLDDAAPEVELLTLPPQLELVGDPIEVPPRRFVPGDTAEFSVRTAIEKCRAGLVMLDDAAGQVLRPGVVDFEVRLGKALLHLGDADALGQLLSAAEHALDADREDELIANAIREACRLGPTSLAGTVHEHARTLLDRAMATVSDPAAVAAVATAGVMLYLVSGEHDRCRAFFELADGYVEPDDVRVGALALAALALTEPGDIGRRVEIERELTSLTPEIGTADAAWAAAHLRMANQVQTGDPAMRETLVELRDLATAMRQRVRHWEATNWSGSVAVTDGDLDRAEALANEGLECLDAVSESLVMSTFGAHLLTIRHAQGRLGDLVDMVQPIVEGASPIGAWRALLACAAADAGDHELARRELEVVCAGGFAVLDRDLTYNAALFVSALAACEIGASDLAPVIEAELAKWSGQWSLIATCTLGPVDVGLARLAMLRGDLSTSRRYASAALVSAERAMAPIYADHARSVLDRLSTLASNG